jgi:hypothetical protein
VVEPPNEAHDWERTEGIGDDDEGEADTEPEPEPEADPGDPPNRTALNQATLIVELVEEGGASFFHTADGDAFATIEEGGHNETYQLTQKRFKNWSRRLYYERTGTVPNADALRDALGVLEGRALWDSPEAQVFTRVGEHEGAIYHDLANEEWEAVEVTANGWDVIWEPPVHFRRVRGQAALPYPVRGGSLEELRAFINVDDDGEHDDDFCLYIAMLVQSLRPSGPYLGYAASGEQGSAKSTRSRIARALIDPSPVPLRSLPHNERDLLIAARNSWLLSFDNVSWVSDPISDALCRLAIGGGLSTRQLYTDDGEIILEAERPFFINGIDEVAQRSDLLDRLLLAHLPRISDDKRRPEAELWAAFDQALPGIYGALLDAVSCALRNLEQVTLASSPRMADAVRWVTAAEPALGWKHGTFVAAYERNRAKADDMALEASPLTRLVISLSEFTGTATELLELLNYQAPLELTRSKSWPRTASVLANRLRRLQPNLRREGVDLDFTREPGGPGGKSGRRRLIVIRRAGEAAGPSVPSDPSPGAGGAREGTGEGTETRLDIDPDRPDASPQEGAEGRKGRKGRPDWAPHGEELLRLLETYRPDLIGNPNVTQAERREVAALWRLYEELGLA